MLNVELLTNVHASKRQRTAKHTDQEQVLFLSISVMRIKNVIVTDAILRTKAKKFGTELHIIDMQLSNLDKKMCCVVN